MEKEVILKLDFDIKDFSQAAADLNKQIISLNEEQKNLKKSGEEGSLQFQKNKEKLSELKKEYNDNQKIIGNLTKANKANAGSMEQMKAQLSILTKQYDLLSKEERENSEEGKKLQSQINKLTSSLKQNEEAVGNHRRSVGDYTKGLNGMQGAAGNAVSGLQRLGDGFKLLLANPVALIITGIVGAFMALKKAFTSTEEGQNKLAKVTAVFSTIWNKLFDIIEPIASFIFDVFVKAFEELGKAAEFALDVVSSALDGLGFSDAAASVREFNHETEKMIRNTELVAKARATADVKERELIVEKAKLETKVSQLREIASQKESKNADERKAALIEAGKLIDEQAQKEEELAKLKFLAIKLENQQTNSNKDAKKAEAEAEAELIRVQKARADNQKKINSELVGVERELEKERADRYKKNQDRIKKQAEAEAKIVEERLKREMDAYKQLDALEISRISDSRERQRAELAAKFDDKVSKLKEDNEAEIELAKQLAIEYQNQVNELEASFKAEDEAKKREDLQKELDLKLYLAQEDLAATNLLLKAKRDSELENAKLTATEKAVIEKRYNKQIEQNEKQITQIKTAENQARLNNLKSVTQLGSQIAKFAGQETKGFALAEVAIDTALAISNLTANSEGNPANSFTFGAAGIAQYVAGLSRIFANINQAKSIISGSGFAEGGYTGDGGKYEVAGVVHKGEYVVPKHIVANPNYSSVISNLESARLKGYANGGLVASNLTQSIDNDFQNRKNLFNLVASLPAPVVVVQDINEVQSDVKTVQVKADI